MHMTKRIREEYSFDPNLGHFKIKSTEEIYKTVDEHQVALGTYKASRFIKPFLKEVDKWERDISHVLEVTDLWLAVQRQWLYLEVDDLLLRIFRFLSIACALEYFLR